MESQKIGKVCRRGWRGVRTNLTAWHFSDIPQVSLLSPSILDDKSDPICIAKTLSDMRLPSRCERLENIDNYRRDPKALATFHLEYCTYYSTLLFTPSSPPYQGTLLSRVSDCAAEAKWGMRRRTRLIMDVAAGFGLEVVLLLLVCAHFQMTPTLIKIIIAAAPRVAPQWDRGGGGEGMEIKTWFKQAQCDQLFFWGTSRVIAVINTWHKTGQGQKPALQNRKGVEQLPRH